jgi:GNAT superfamily N-acetyltransferase
LIACEDLRFEELRPDLWSMVERLFGLNGACGGCWCMCWRMPTYKAWEKIKGAGAKRAFMDLVQKGKAKGILAFAEDEPVSWCSFGPRRDFPVLQNSKAYARDDVNDVWSVTCFFVHRNWRQRGLSRRLLKAAVEVMRRRGVKTVEAYPITTTRDGRRVGSSSAWTGPLRIFEELGFETVQLINPLKPLVRLEL